MLERMAKVELLEILAETGHSLLLEDFDDIYALNQVARSIASPDIGSAEFDIWGTPTIVRDLLLFPPGLGAIAWIEEHIMEWFKDDPFTHMLGIAYALNRTNLPDDLWALADRRKARREIHKFWRRLKCTANELRAGVERMLPDASTNSLQNADSLRSCLQHLKAAAEMATATVDLLPQESEDADHLKLKNIRANSRALSKKLNSIDLELDGPLPSNAYGPIIALLSREYPANTSHWYCWKASPGLVEALTDDYTERLEATMRETRRLSIANQTAAGSLPAPPVTPHMRKIKKLRLMKNGLKQKWLNP